MKKFYIGLLSFVLVVITVFYVNTDKNYVVKADKIKRSGHKATPAKMKAARYEYFHKMLRDPATNEIPKNIHIRDQKFAEAYQKSVPHSLFKANSAGGFNYVEAGPHDVGGRTRALAYDIKGNYILSGGVSGGVWKSADEGESWTLKSTKNDLLAVSSFAQDPREGHTNIWYYVSGEINGPSASATGAFYTGGGLFKSTDHGETWIEIIKDNDFKSWSNVFDNCGRIIVDKNGHVYVASFGYGIYKSTDGGNNFDKILGDGTYVYTDIEVDVNGNLLGYLSPYDWGRDDQIVPAGIHYSTDAGVNWEQITLTEFETNAERGMVRIAPSNTDVAYLFYYTGANDKYGFYKVNLDTKSVEKRNDNLPDYTQVDLGNQSNYNMVFEIFPEDENLVIIGGTSLFKSFDGYATKPSALFLSKTHIGGYQMSSSASYPNHHADQHSLIFDPNNKKRVFSGHDGGLSFTEDITLNSISQMQNWESKNNGYNVTQFYTFAIAPASTDNRMVGGTQDNGSPFFSTTVDTSYDISSGDGSFCYFGKDDIFVSSQYGTTYRLGLAQNGGNPPNIFVSGGFDWDQITPITGEEQNVEMHFINPFAIDPNDEKYVYFPSKHQFWRNNNVRMIQGEEGTSSNGYSQGPTDDFWTKISSITIGNDMYTAVSVSNLNKSHVVYLGVSGDGKPKVIRYDDAKTATAASISTTITEAASGAHLQEIAVNPKNSDEILVVLTNYNIKSVWYSDDGAQTFSSVGGELGGVDGPSIRTAEIISTDKGNIYLLGTSTGLYGTSELNGDNTVWFEDGRNVTGNVVVGWITSRISDNKVAIATHGRGAFIGTYDPNLIVGVDDEVNTPEGFALAQNYPNPFNPSTTINYSLAEEAKVVIEIFNVNGQRIKKLIDENKEPGDHKVVWNATNNNGSKVASGVYFYRIKAGNFVQTKKMNVLK